MIIDSYGYIQMEQTQFPGSVGDSAAETGRYTVLAYYNGKKLDINLSKFLTEKGVLRHPESPWREDDTSGDQVLPLISASSLTQPEIADKIIKFIKDNHWKTGNGQLIHPATLAVINRHTKGPFQWFYDMTFLGQAILFKLPYRWSDSKKWFEKNNSSADYLNFMNAIYFSKLNGGLTWPCKLALKLISKDEVYQKIESYYKIEPNSTWVLDLYKESFVKE